MAKKSALSPKSKPAKSSPRVSIIHLQGKESERDWLTDASKKTHIGKNTIVRLAIEAWAKTQTGLPPYPRDITS